MPTNPFPYDPIDPATSRPWLRVTDAQRAVSRVVLAKGDFALTDTGRMYTGNGVVMLKDLAEKASGGSGTTGVALDTDGVYYPSSTGSAAILADTDGVFYPAA